METHTDSLLISRYQKGDENALSILISRHQKELFSFIFYKLMDEELANDVFQDTFMKIIVSLKEGRYNDDGKFILWAKRKIMLIITAFMIGMSNGMNVGKNTIHGNQNYTEQHKKD